ncbi:MAG TPA: histidine kinase, partial [Clostridia bacterium]|nr:histidine kinase [Clostridia bacterium]
YLIAANTIENTAVSYSSTITEKLESEYRRLYRIGNTLANITIKNTSILNSLLTSYESPDALSIANIYFRKELDYAQYNIDIFNISVIGTNGIRSCLLYRPIKDVDFTLEEWYQEIARAKKAVWFAPHKNYLTNTTRDGRYVSLGIPIYSPTNNKMLGVVIIDFTEKSFAEILDIPLGKTGYFTIVDDSYTSIITPSKYSNAEIDFSNTKELSHKGQKYIYETPETYLITTSLPFPNWRLCGVLPKAEIAHELNTLITVILLIIIILSAISVLLSYWLSKRITSPLRKLTKLMQQVQQGRLDITMEHDSNDEIGVLSENFNIMLNQIKELIDDVYQKQRSLHIAEFKALQAQINPHFLYNTLDSVIWMARKKQTDEIIEMVTALTNLFRITVNKGMEIISIADEIKHIHHYLTIQKMRFKEKINFSVDIEPGLFNYYTPKLILQPLVENSINHGTSRCKNGGFITVSAKELSDHIELAVHDTGIGMTSKERENTQKLLDDSPIFEKSSSSYGLRNIQERIQVLFGKEYGLSFTTKYKCGTTFILSIPKLTKEDAYDKSNNC